MDKPNYKAIIFGRTNVGKSTLFNCLTGGKQALVSDIEGTTRDSNTGTVEWNRKSFTLIDTGGIMDIKDFTSDDKKNQKLKTTGDIDKKVQLRVRKNLTDADLILFVVDTRAGLMANDRAMAMEIKKLKIAKEKIIVVANKADGPALKNSIAEFNKLGLGEPMAVSSANGTGTGDLLDVITENINIKPKKETEAQLETKKPTEKKESADKIKITIIGKPNVGKSSMINKMTGEEKVIVSPVAHTTREPQDIEFTYKNQQFTLIDTAGISKQGQKKSKQKKDSLSLEKISISKSINAINKADLVMIMIDINEGLTVQEAKITEEAIIRKKGLIIVANKWDLVKEKDVKKFTNEIHRTLPFAQWAPIQFASALTGEKIYKILDLALEISDSRKKEISTSQLEHFLKKIVRRHPPTKGRGTKNPYIYEIKQTEINPPAFSVRTDATSHLDQTYLRYIENQLRESFKITGSPITVYVEKKKKVHGAHGELGVTGKKRPAAHSTKPKTYNKNTARGKRK